MQAILSEATQAACIKRRTIVQSDGRRRPLKQQTALRRHPDGLRLIENSSLKVCLGLPVDMILPPFCLLTGDHQSISGFSLLPFTHRSVLSSSFWRRVLRLDLSRIGKGVSSQRERENQSQFCSKCPWWCEGRSLSCPGKNQFALYSFRYFFFRH